MSCKRIAGTGAGGRAGTGACAGAGAGAGAGTDAGSGTGFGSGAGGMVPLAGAVLCGMGIGAEIDLMAFFISRYFGLKAYGKIYGVMFALFNIGTGLGPALSGRSFEL